MNRLPKIQPLRSVPKQGSALLLTLLVVSLLLVIVLSFVVGVRLELRQITVNQNLTEARANARLGLQLALGELQTAAGPDRRSVARAGLMVNHSRLGGPPVATNPSDSRNYWVGISHSDGTSNVDMFNQPVVWLVSGLNPSQTSTEQINSVLDDPVTLFTLRQTTNPSSSAEVTLRAGKRPITKPDGTLAGKYAWIIDDETQKAKLAPSVNALNATPGQDLAGQRSVLPGFFNLFETTDLTAPDGDFLKAGKLQDIALNTSGDAERLNDRYFDYTLSGYGVLSDTRNGGLKRDLTAAYENPNAFDELFPDLRDTPGIVMDEDKFASAEAADLQDNGYIHHGVFRDYYQLKDQINANSLPLSVIDKRLFDDSADEETRLGNVGPHEINNLGHPYGNFTIWSGIASTAPTTQGAHNPITPVLSFMQQNAWVEGIGDQSIAAPKFMNKAQLWLGIYNPYNIEIDISARGSAGPMAQGYPGIHLFLLNNSDGSIAGVDDISNPTRPPQGFMLRPSRWMYAQEPVSIAPGKTQVFGFGDDVETGDTEGGRPSRFTKNIAGAVDKEVYRERSIVLSTDPVTTLPAYPTLDMLVEFTFLGQSWRSSESWQGPNMGWGLPYEADPGNSATHNGHEMAQIFYVPFSEDFLTDGVDQGVDKSVLYRRRFSSIVAGTPGTQFYRRDIANAVDPLQEQRMSPANEAVYRLTLRTTTENGPDDLRPLIDGNIRAVWNNPKWDHSLNTRALATYVYSDNKTTPEQDVFPAQPNNRSGTDPDEGFLTYGNSFFNGDSQEVILFDIPREPLVSIAQLQHAAAGRFSYEPSYIVGNSYANVRIPLENWVEQNARDTYSNRHNGVFGISGDFSLFDASYLVNEALFDGYTFTTIPQDSPPAELVDFYLNNQLLQNPRYLPYEPRGLSFTSGTLQSNSSGRSNAGFILVDGAFNVNSTSVEAWEVFLSGTKGLPYSKMNTEGAVTGFEPVDGVRFPRVQTILGEPWETAPDQDAWFGFRELTTAEVRLLAEAIVQLIQERGPFHTLSEFINRPLQDNESGTSGVLQAALDAVINSSIPSSFEDEATAAFDQIAANSTQGAGFPTQILQGDLLQALAPYMQTRSDTFTIRSYAEVLSPQSGDVISRVRCEAVVQRVPDPIADSSAGSALDKLAAPTSPFGRRFEIIAFRWLNDEES